MYLLNLKPRTSPTTEIRTTMQNIENGVVWGIYGSLKVAGNCAIWQSVCEFLLAFHSNFVPILRRFLRDSEILVENRRFRAILHPSLAPRFGVTPLEFCRSLWRQNESSWAIVRRCLRDFKFSRFSTWPACDGRTDRRTDTMMTAYTALFSGCPSAAFIRLSRWILLLRYLVNGLSSFDETYREYY